MSRGYFGYDQYRSQNVIECIEAILYKNKTGEAEEWEKFDAEILELFQEDVEAIELACIYANRIGYLLSSIISRAYQRGTRGS